MLASTLANQKEHQIKGGNVSYYLVTLANGVVVEIEDIIEYFNMSFALGTQFKSLVRLCKLRQDLGKPGSTSDYERQKVSYYCDRLYEITRKRNQMGWWRSFVCGLRSIQARYDTYDYEEAVVTITEPKRLEPYQFRVSEFIQALHPTHAEGDLFINVFNLAFLRAMEKPTRDSLSVELLTVQDSVRTIPLLMKEAV
jgi:hypothetical protein